MKVLVLGGTGAMGAPIVDILSRRQVEVYVTSRSERFSDNPFIHYIKGDAHDKKFLDLILSCQYDAIVDFMIYTEKEFVEHSNYFLNKTKQYIYFSSARVYAYSEKRLTEESDRLLDVINDLEYKKSTEYALEKAREENILFNDKRKNWTIIRPYITFYDERLQLGILEKEYWLYRATKGRTIVFSKDMLDNFTTLTYGSDVAIRVAELICNPEALGKVFHITNDQELRWKEVLNIYVSVLERIYGVKISVHMIETSDDITKLLGNKYQLVYDRLYDRLFDSTKINNVCKAITGYTDTKEALEKCIENFLTSKQCYVSIDWRLEAYYDRITREHTSLSEIKNLKDKLRYMLFRYTPYLSLKYKIK